MDLRLDLHRLAEDHGNTHAQTLMRDLGIAYEMSVPQSIYDCWWFLGCANVPSQLPRCLTRMVVNDYSNLVGHGLSHADAEHLTKWRSDQAKGEG